MATRGEYCGIRHVKALTFVFLGSFSLLSECFKCELGCDSE